MSSVPTETDLDDEEEEESPATAPIPAPGLLAQAASLLSKSFGSSSTIVKKPAPTPAGVKSLQMAAAAAKKVHILYRLLVRTDLVWYLDI